MMRDYLCILAGGAIWGSIGIFVRLLAGSGLNSWEVVACRGVGATLIFALAMYLTDPKLFKIKAKDIWIFFAAGFVSHAGFNFCNFSCITLSSLAVAALLMYTAPIFVMLLSVVFLGEKLTVTKLLALITTFIGCALITGVLEENVKIDMAVLGFGIASGLGYALFSFFSKIALNRHYEAITVTTYNFLFCALAAIIMAGGVPFAKLDGQGWLGMLGISLLCSFGANLLYTTGLRNIEAGHASILATIEPFMAAVIGFLLFGETLSSFKLIGMALILGAILVLNLQSAK